MSIQSVHAALILLGRKEDRKEGRKRREERKKERVGTVCTGDVHV
jgi:hypothetical protein